MVDSKRFVVGYDYRDAFGSGTLFLAKTPEHCTWGYDDNTMYWSDEKSAQEAADKANDYFVPRKATWTVRTHNG